MRLPFWRPCRRRRPLPATADVALATTDEVPAPTDAVPVTADAAPAMVNAALVAAGPAGPIPGMGVVLATTDAVPATVGVTPGMGVVLAPAEGGHVAVGAVHVTGVPPGRTRGVPATATGRPEAGRRGESKAASDKAAAFVFSRPARKAAP